MKKQIALIFGILLTLALMSVVYASVSANSYCFLKMGDKQTIPSTANSVAKHLICAAGKCTCNLASGRGFCQVCTNSSGWSAAYTKCQDVCPANNANEVNMTLTVNWPFSNGEVFTKQSFILNVLTNKITNIDLIDNVLGTEKNLCPNCKEYRKSYTARQGFNDITIRAVKGAEIKEKRVSFFVDNQKPRISKVLPSSNQFVSGAFTVYYDEANVKEIKLNYGTSSRILANCSSGKKQSCSIDVDLKAFDGQTISYWFEIKDIANNVVASRQTKINVDETFPVINSLKFSQLKNYITFTMNITEKNLDKVYYSDNGEREKVLCTSLSKGICTKKLSFKTGEHSVDLRVVDKAGNAVAQSVSFVI